MQCPKLIKDMSIDDVANLVKTAYDVPQSQLQQICDVFKGRLCLVKV